MNDLTKANVRNEVTLARLDAFQRETWAFHQDHERDMRLITKELRGAFRSQHE